MSKDKKVICLIDDEYPMEMALRLDLEEQFGDDKFELHYFDTIIGAAHFLQHSKADVLITDLSVSSRENSLAGFIRTQKTLNPQMKVALMSGYGAGKAGEQLAAGFNGLPKLVQDNPASAGGGDAENSLTPGRAAQFAKSSAQAERAAEGTLNQYVDTVFSKHLHIGEDICYWLEENVFNEHAPDSATSRKDGFQRK